MKEPRQERRNYCVSEHQKKKQSIDRETKSFIEGLVHLSVNSLGDILRMQMPNMESMFKERMGDMESEVSQLREAIRLSAEGSVPKSKTDEAPPKSKTVQAPAKKKVLPKRKCRT